MSELWQLTRWSLMHDARRSGLHVVRFGLAAVLYLAVIAANLQTTTTAAGLPLFHAQLLITAFYLSANAIFGFSQTFAEEKEDGTLGLMRMAGVSALAILFGKTLGRLTDAGLLIAVQFPFTIIAVTLGGVSLQQVSAAYGALTAYLWLLAAISVTASVLASNGGPAAWWTAIFVIVYTVVPFAFLIAPAWLSTIVWNLYRPVCLPVRLADVMESGFNDPAWCSAMGVGLVTGAVCLSGAWLLFDRVAIGGEIGGLWAAASAARPERPDQLSRSGSRRRAWDLPIIGREYQFVTGGTRWLVVRVIAHMALLLLGMAAIGEIGRGFAWGSVMCGLLSIFDATWSGNRLFREEIRDQTWSSLVLTPRSLKGIAADKCVGWVLGLSPSILLPYLWALTTLVTMEHLPFEIKCEVLVGSTTIFVSALAYVHLLVWLSLYLGWQATPLTLTVCFAAGFVYVTGLTPWRGPWETRCLLYIATCGAWLGVMWWLQRRILVRLEVLAGTE